MQMDIIRYIFLHLFLFKNKLKNKKVKSQVNGEIRNINIFER